MRITARENLANICQMIGQTVETEQIYLFGSYAYGAPNEDSDYDLCVIIQDDTLRPVDAVKKIRRTLFEVQDTPLDVIVYRASVFQQKQKSASLERKIAREGVLLYERNSLAQRMA